MSNGTPSSSHNLKPCMCVRGIKLKLGRKLQLTSDEEAHMKHMWNLPERREVLGRWHQRRTTTVQRCHICRRQHWIATICRVVWILRKQKHAESWLTKVAAHVHADTIPEAIKPGLILLEALLNSSELLGEKPVYRAWMAVRISMNALKNNPIPFDNHQIFGQIMSHDNTPTTAWDEYNQIAWNVTRCTPHIPTPYPAPWGSTGSFAFVAILGETTEKQDKRNWGSWPRFVGFRKSTKELSRHPIGDIVHIYLMDGEHYLAGCIDNHSPRSFLETLSNV